MQVQSITVEPLRPPQDDLLRAIQNSTLQLLEGDVVCVSSKVVAIHEDRCIANDKTNKQYLYARQSDFIIPRSYWGSPLTVVHHTFLGAAGIDESNGDGYVIQLPLDPFASAKKLYKHLRNHFSIKNLGVIVTDSRSLPFRYGASGVALGWWGIKPLQNHVGQSDIFGRKFQYERSNLVDGLAAAATVVMGETNECQPIVRLRDVPNLVFTTKNTKPELFCPYDDDTFRVLYEKWLPR